MARNAPISVKDLTAALAIGKQQAEQERQVAEKRDDSPVRKPGGKPWPGYPNPMPPGKDWPVELAHEGQHYDKHGRKIKDPAKGMLPSGELIHMDHMEQSPQEHKDNEEMFKWKYEDGPEPGTFDKVMELAQELNPAQLKILKGIPADINSRSAGERLKIMRSITSGVRGAA